jgi:hypothetical protein
MPSDRPPEAEREGQDTEPEHPAVRRSERPERPRLASRTVRRSDEPDRWTVFPADATGVPRMSTWLSVNADCVVDLEAFR